MKRVHLPTVSLPTVSIAVVALLAAACSDDSDKPTNADPEEPAVFEPVENAGLEFSRIRAEINQTCAVGNITLRHDDVFGVFSSGLWLGGRIDGKAHVNVVWVGGSRFSNYTTQESPPEGRIFTGPYLVTPSHLENEENTFPVDLGFPTTRAGEPGLYGDGMVWTRFRNALADELSPETSSPLPGLEGTMSVFALDAKEFEYVLFYRWDITNTSDAPWTGVFCGFYADTDLHDFGNATGYLPEGISYTRHHESVDEPQWVSGLAFLETPSGGLVHAHRPMYKNNHNDYGENVDRPEQLLWALEGLTNSGQPMIDPSTNEETRFAFSGNPFNGKGWIQDTFADRRGMISSGPFDVDPGETIEVISIWTVGEGVNLSAALNDLRTAVMDVRDRAGELLEVSDGGR